MVLTVGAGQSETNLPLPGGAGYASPRAPVTVADKRQLSHKDRSRDQG